MILVEKESIIHSHGSNTVFLRGFQIQQGLKAGKMWVWKVLALAEFSWSGSLSDLILA